MNIFTFKDKVHLFQDQPTPGRKVFIWHGSKDRLLKLLPSHLCYTIDLIDIAPATDKTTEEGIRKLIKKSLSSALEGLFSNLTAQQILIVLNNYLLARYKVSLTPFYEIYLSDKTMVVFHVEKHAVRQQIPKFVTYNPKACINYLVNAIPQEHKDNIIEEEQ